jgi:protein-tyrosine phosphatase
VQRQIRLDGCANFRDAGGYQVSRGEDTACPPCWPGGPPLASPGGLGPAAGPPVTSSQSRIRWRRLFRSDALNELSAADVALLTGRLGVTTVVDLRTGHERQRDGRRPLERADVEIINTPLLTERNAAAVEKPGLTLAERYLWMLELAGDPLAQAVTAVARAPGPVIVHCAAGKDRTGLVIATILGVLGVGDDDIIADYTLTTENLGGIEQRLARRGVSHQTVPDAVIHAPAGAMREVLAGLRDRHGSVGGFLAAAGAGRLVVDELAAALVEPR